MDNVENIRGKFNKSDLPLDQCVSQPEPEESQKELESEENIMQDLLIDYREMRKRGSTYFSIALCLLDKYSIQRKK